MSRKSKILIVFFVLLLFILTGCIWGKDKPADGDESNSTKKSTDSLERKALLVKDQELVVVYFATPDRKNLVPVTLSTKPTNEAPRIAVEKLLAGPENDFSLPTIPEGTKLKDLYLLGSTAYVDLTEEIMNISDDMANQTIDALVFTLTEFPAVEDVQILINSQIYQEIGPVDISKPIKRPHLINYYGKDSPGNSLAKVYFADANAMYLVPITVEVNEKNPPLAALKKLVAGPPEKSGLISTVWEGTGVNSLEVVDGLATVDFNAETLGYGGGSTAETMLVNSVVLTLTQFPEIKGVQFLIDGEKIEYFPEGTDVSNPLSAPTKINFSE
ncbi:MAG: GerMN domain-containing protein [Bacillota bacterium]|nr:GerMN domain-containing protein [Clostridia bacterium]